MAGVLKFKFEVKGMEQALKALANLPSSVSGPALRNAVKASAEPTLLMARFTVPQNREGGEHYVLRKPKKSKEGYKVPTPHAIGQISSKAKLGKNKETAFVVIGVRNSAFYATQFVEVGTSKQAPQPWLRPAFESSRTQTLAIIRDKLKKKVERYARQQAAKRPT